MPPCTSLMLNILKTQVPVLNVLRENTWRVARNVTHSAVFRILHNVCLKHPRYSKITVIPLMMRLVISFRPEHRLLKIDDRAKSRQTGYVPEVAQAVRCHHMFTGQIAKIHFEAPVSLRTSFAPRTALFTTLSSASCLIHRTFQFIVPYLPILSVVLISYTQSFCKQNKMSLLTN